MKSLLGSTSHQSTHLDAAVRLLDVLLYVVAALRVPGNIHDSYVQHSQPLYITGAQGSGATFCQQL